MEIRADEMELRRRHGDQAERARREYDRAEREARRRRPKRTADEAHDPRAYGE